MANTLVIAEYARGSLKQSTFSVLTAAQVLKQPIDIVVIGSGSSKVVDMLTTIPLVQTIFTADADSLEDPTAEQLVALLEPLAKNAGTVMVPATTFGKNFMPRLAARLGVGQISDIIQVESADTFVRPIYAGNILATVQSHDPIKVITVRPTAFAPATAGDGNAAQVHPLSIPAFSPTSKVMKVVEIATGRPDLATARVVISGGRGLQNAENFKLLEALAVKLGAAVGASRVAVDSGYVPNDYQVGQTGKVVAPELYIAVGISGAIQHLAGMKESKVIVAINKDPDAPIFQIADYGLVGDLFEIIPEMTKALP